MVYSIQSPQQNAAQAQKTHFASPHAAAQAGRLGNVRVKKLANPSQLIEDLQEELSIARSEDLESKKIEERHDEKKARKIYALFIEKIEQKYPPKDEPQKKHLQTLLRALQQQKPKTGRQLEDLLATITDDKAEALALLESAKKDESLDKNTKTLLEKTAVAFAAKHEKAIHAGINTLDVSKVFSQKLQQESSQLQSNYQTLVFSYQGILPALTQLAKKGQLGKFDAMRDFLMQSTAKDLAAPSTSTQPRRLLHILSALQGIKIFNTIHSWAGNTYEKIKSSTKQQTLSQSGFLYQVMKYIGKPESFNSEINLPLRELTPSQRVLTLQGLRQGVRGLPAYLFEGGEADKARLLLPLQNEIDKLVFEQDA